MGKALRDQRRSSLDIDVFAHMGIIRITTEGVRVFHIAHRQFSRRVRDRAVLIESASHSFKEVGDFLAGIFGVINRDF